MDHPAVYMNYGREIIHLARIQNARQTLIALILPIYAHRFSIWSMRWQPFTYIYIYGIEHTKEMYLMHGGDIVETLTKDQSHQTKERVLCIKPYKDYNTLKVDI